MSSLILKNKNNLFEKLYKTEIFTEEMINALGFKKLPQFYKAEEIDLYKFRDAILNNKEYDIDLFIELSNNIVKIKNEQSVKYKRFDKLFEKLGGKMVKYLGEGRAWDSIFDFNSIGGQPKSRVLQMGFIINSTDVKLYRGCLGFERKNNESLENYIQRALDSITEYESEIERLIDHEKKWEDSVIVPIIDLLCQTLHAVNFEKLIKEMENNDE